MKFLITMSFVLVAAFAVPAWALPADHPANPEARVPVFQPSDYFSASSQRLAAAEPESAGHDHGAAASGDDAAPAEEEGKNCKRGGGCCCCCKCCGKDKEEKREPRSGDMKGCDMMKKMMDKDKDAAKPAGKDDEHASHH